LQLFQWKIENFDDSRPPSKCWAWIYRQDIGEHNYSCTSVDPTNSSYIFFTLQESWIRRKKIKLEIITVTRESKQLSSRVRKENMTIYWLSEIVKNPSNYAADTRCCVYAIDAVSYRTWAKNTLGTISTPSTYAEDTINWTCTIHAVGNSTWARITLSRSTYNINNAVCITFHYSKYIKFIHSHIYFNRLINVRRC